VVESCPDKAAVDLSGRPLGPRAQNTRRRLLDATVSLLEATTPMTGPRSST